MKTHQKIFLSVAAIGFASSFLAGCDSKIEQKKPKSYTVTISKNIADAGEINGNGTYESGSDVTVNATVNQGYLFDGWYKDNVRLSKETSYTFAMPSNNVKYTAKYTINSYRVNVFSDNNLKGMVSGGGTFKYGSNVTVNASPITDQYSLTKRVFLGWYENDVKVSDSAAYTFEMPYNDVNLTAKFDETSKTTGDSVLFGRYPQSRVIDDSLIKTLKEKVGEFPPTDEEMYDFSAYNWYKNSLNDESFGFYQDIDLDEDGVFDYRAVHLEEFRPKNTQDEATETGTNTYQYANGYRCGEEYIYFFKYDPIEWTLLKDNDGDYFLHSSKLLDVEQFNNYIDDGYVEREDYQGNKEFCYANNYKYSEIRTFLNDDFYHTAFNDEECSRVQITNVDNSAKSSGYELNDYSCENTNDKMFLLSYEEITNENYGFVDNKSRMFKPTDYAKCMGAYVSFNNKTTEYWLRSANNESEFEVRRIGLDGSEYAYDSRTAYFGVLPAMHIK